MQILINLFGILMWTLIVLFFLPKLYGFWAKHRDEIRECARIIKRAMRR